MALTLSSVAPKLANVQFDADGDVLLLLHDNLGGVARFQVSSSALCLASPVFRAMLGANGSFKESKSLQERKGSEPPIEITLGGDNPQAMAVILRIIHHQHDYVPESLSEINLWQIAVLVDKYDLREAIKLWINLWIKPYLVIPGLSCFSYLTEDTGLFLAYAFGNEILFRSISKDIILKWKCTLLQPECFSYVPQTIVGIYIYLFLWFNPF